MKIGDITTSRLLEVMVAAVALTLRVHCTVPSMIFVFILCNYRLLAILEIVLIRELLSLSQLVSCEVVSSKQASLATKLVIIARPLWRKRLL